MIDEIYTIHYNSIGIAFKWKRGSLKDLNKTQLVFKDSGLYLSTAELTRFAELIDQALSKPLKCSDCTKDQGCKSTLIQTPISDVTFVMSHNELLEMQDLLKGTLFQLGLNSFLEKNVIKRNV